MTTCDIMYSVPYTYYGPQSLLSYYSVQSNILLIGYSNSRWESNASLQNTDNHGSADPVSTQQSATQPRLSSVPDQTSRDGQRSSSVNVRSVVAPCSTPPPLPRKQSQVESPDTAMYMAPHSVKMRHHSHKGMVCIVYLLLPACSSTQVTRSTGPLSVLSLAHRKKTTDHC